MNKDRIGSVFHNLQFSIGFEVRVTNLVYDPDKDENAKLDFDVYAHRGEDAIKVASSSIEVKPEDLKAGRPKHMKQQLRNILTNDLIEMISG